MGALLTVLPIYNMEVVMVRETGPLLAGVADMNKDRWTLTSVVGIAGRMRTGKTTLAGNLAHMDSRYKLMSIGDVVRGDVAGLLRVPFIEVVKNKGVYLPMLQLHAQMGRAIHGDDYFVARMLQIAAKRKYQYVIVDDVRAVADVEALRKAGMSCHIVHLTASLATIAKRFTDTNGRKPTNGEINHATEVELEPSTLANRGIKLYFDQHVDTSDQTPENVALWVANMLHGRGFDFDLPWYESEDARKEMLWLGPKSGEGIPLQSRGGRAHQPLFTNPEIAEAPGA